MGIVKMEKLHLKMVQRAWMVDLVQLKEEALVVCLKAKLTDNKRLDNKVSNRMRNKVVHSRKEANKINNKAAKNKMDLTNKEVSNKIRPKIKIINKVDTLVQI